MPGRLLDYIAQGLAADRPAAVDMPARIATGGTSIYFDNTTNTFSFFNASTVAWVELDLDAIATDFLALSDTPNDYTGSEEFLVRVKTDGSGLEFLDPDDLVPPPAYVPIQKPAVADFAHVTGTDAVTLVDAPAGGVISSGNQGGFRTSKKYLNDRPVVAQDFSVRAILNQTIAGAYTITGIAIEDDAADSRFGIFGFYCDGTAYAQPNFSLYTSYGNNAAAGPTTGTNFGALNIVTMGIQLDYDQSANTLIMYVTFDGRLWKEFGRNNNVSAQITGGIGRLGLGMFTTSGSGSNPFNFGCSHFEVFEGAIEPLPTLPLW